MKKLKPRPTITVSLTLSDEQEDAIVANAIRQAYQDTTKYPVNSLKDDRELLEAFRRVYRFYTGKSLGRTAKGGAR